MKRKAKKRKRSSKLNLTVARLIQLLRTIAKEAQ
jgi:hypothetical protein